MTIYVLLALSFTFWCLWLLKGACSKFAVAKESRYWRQTRGRMLSTELWGLRNVDGAMRDVERLSIRYAYEVDGHRYESSRVAFFTVIYPETVQFAEKYPAGSAVSVRFDPRDPSNATIIPGLNPAKPYSDIVLAGLGVLVGTGVTIGLYTAILDAFR